MEEPAIALEPSRLPMMAMPMDGETFMARSFMPTPRPDSSFSMVPSTVETTGEYIRPQPA